MTDPAKRGGREKFGVRQRNSRRSRSGLTPDLGAADPDRPPYPANPPATTDAERLAAQKQRAAERKQRRKQ